MEIYMTTNMTNLADIMQTLPGRKPQLVELGKIKIGGLGDERTSRGGKKYRMPVKYDHFVITTMNRDQGGALVPDDALMSQLRAGNGGDGDNLTHIPIRVLSNDIDDIMQSAWVWYGGKRVGGRSDGKTVTWFNDRLSGKTLDNAITEDWKPEYTDLTMSDKKTKLFKFHTVFNCVIASTDARWGGVYKLRTTSTITATQLYESLMHLSQLTAGILVGMPLELVMRPLQVHPNGITTTVYVVHVELRGPDLKEIQDQALQHAQFMLTFKGKVQETQQQYKALLVAPGHESQGDTADIEAEFHPIDEANGDDVIADPLLGDDDTPAATSPPDGEPSDEEKAAIISSEQAEQDEQVQMF
jgi:hypothetical protein